MDGLSHLSNADRRTGRAAILRIRIEMLPEGHSDRATLEAELAALESPPESEYRLPYRDE